MKKIIVLAVVALAAFSLMLQPVLAGQGQCKAGRPGIAARQGIGKSLNLTDDQKTAIKSIMQGTREQIKALRADNSLTPDQKKAKAKGIRESTQAQVRGVLTPDQAKKYDEMLAKRQVLVQRGRKAWTGFVEQLNLTDAQKASIKSIKESQRDQIKALRGDKSQTPEQKRTKFQEIRKSTREQVMQVLTPEQKAKIKELAAQHRRGAVNKTR